MRRDASQIAEVLAVKSSVDVVAVFLVVRNEAEWSKEGRKLFDWNDTVRREATHDSVVTGSAQHRSIRLRLHHVQDLSVSEESQTDVLDHVLENEVFVIVAHRNQIGKHVVVNGSFPFLHLVGQLSQIVDLLLSHV